MERRTPEGREKKRQYIRQYNAGRYESLTLTLQRGERERIKGEAASRGMSATRLVMAGVNEYIANHPLP